MGVAFPTAVVIGAANWPLRSCRSLFNLAPHGFPMTKHDFAELFAAYPAVIESMPTTFTSHAFILKLAQASQRAYVEALHSYRDGDAPFRDVHAQLAAQLKEHSDLIGSAGKADSPDIFGAPGRCEQWDKVDRVSTS